MRSTLQRFTRSAVAVLSLAGIVTGALAPAAVAGQPSGWPGSFGWQAVVTPAQDSRGAATSPGATETAEMQANALYGDAQAYINLREWSAARRILQAIVDQHPGTNASARAALDLARMDAEVFSPSQRFSLGGPESVPGGFTGREGQVGSRAPQPSVPSLAPPAATTPSDPLEWLLGSQPLQDKFRADVGDRIFFSAHSAALGQRGMSVLEAQARWLRENAATEVRIEAHADEPGSDDTETGVALNERIARARAVAVRDVIVAAGVDPARVTIDVAGRSRRVAVCDSAACRAQNRRVLLRVSPSERRFGSARPPKS